MYIFLSLISEIRTGCGFRENMIQVANRHCDFSRLGIAYLLSAWKFYPSTHDILLTSIIISIFAMLLEGFIVFKNLKNKLHAYLFFNCMVMLVNNTGYLLELLSQWIRMEGFSIIMSM